MSSVSANPDSDLPFRVRLWEYWKRNLILVHAALMLCFLFGSYIILKSVDPRIGVVGFGDLFGYVLNGVRATMIIFTAFWMKRWMWFPLHDRTELELYQDIVHKGNTLTERFMWRDRVEWFAALAFSTYWYTQ